MKRIMTMLLMVAFALTLAPAYQASANGDTQENASVKTITEAVIRRSQERRGASAEQAVGSCSPSTAWWFDLSVGDGGATDMEMRSNFSWCKINGSNTNFFVDAKGSAYGQGGKQLLAFEPWIQSGTSAARWIAINPSAYESINSTTSVTFSLNYNGTGASVTYTPTVGERRPFFYSDGTYYSVQWRGIENSDRTVGQAHVSRWGGGDAGGMKVGNCAFLGYSVNTYLRGSCPRSNTP